VIRQAISCDICATEKKQTNHWFVASEQGGELRVSGWNSRNRLRPGMKHLCGQTCLHKLVDEFMARTLAMRLSNCVAEDIPVQHQAAATDASLTSETAYEEVESSARLVTSPLPSLPKRPLVKPAPELVPMPVRPPAEPTALPVTLSDEPPRYSSRNWRAEAWDREREREMRSIPDTGARRRSGSL
jgi:hypothetical protein